MNDIATKEDIELLVNTFYAKAGDDELLGPIFNGVIQDRWPQHLQKMYGFWGTILLHEQAYTGSPFPPHSKLPVAQQHFDRWLALWGSTVDSLFAGELATEAKWRAEKMAAVFIAKLDYYRTNDGIALV